MKKLIASVAAGAMIFSAGQALAFFEDLNLIRSIYTKTGTVEVGSDLGADVSTFKVAPGFVVPPTSPVNEFRGDHVSLSAFDGDLSSLVIGYWAHHEASSDFYATGFLTTAYGGSDTNGLEMLGKKLSVANSNFNNTQIYYSNQARAGEATATITKTTNSYWNRFDVNQTNVGSMGASLAKAEMTVSLADLATTGYVDQLLYWFDYGTGATAKLGVEVAVIRTFLTSDGKTIDLSGDKLATVINPVPIPAAGWLLGSGLLALIGIRRRNG